VPARDGVGVPARDGVGVPARDGVGVPARDGGSVPAREGVAPVIPSGARTRSRGTATHLGGHVAARSA